jgi:hypothetical protein
VDTEDYERLAQYNWRTVNLSSTGVGYAGRMNSRKTGKRKLLLMHRIIMDAPDGVEVDHRDGNGFNNRRSNLRLATRAQNAHNRKAAAHNSSGYKGVTRSRLGKWQAQIKANGKYQWLGDYETPEAASQAYIEAAKRLHGEFARW